MLWTRYYSLHTDGVPAIVFDVIDDRLELASSVLVLVVPPVVAIRHPCLVYSIEKYSLAVVVKMVTLNIKSSWK